MYQIITLKIYIWLINRDVNSNCNTLITAILCKELCAVST